MSGHALATVVAALLSVPPEAPSTLNMRDLETRDPGGDVQPGEHPVEPLTARPSPPRAGPRPYYGLALLETSLALGGGAIWYWQAARFNSRDWDLHWDWQSWEQKIVTFDAPRFDDNDFDTNALWHPLDGAGLYAIGRGNHLAPLPSLALVAVSSFAWEYFVEFREYPSVNDMVFTPMAAISLAEPVVRVAAFLRAGSDGPITDVVATLLDPVGAVNGHFENRGRHRPEGPTDAWGLPTSYRHRLDLFAGFGQTDLGAGTQRREGDFGADLFVDSTPGFGRPGQAWRPAGTGALTFLAGGAAIDDGRVVGAGVSGKVFMGGAQFRDFEATFDPKPRGQTLFLGAASGFEYTTRSSPTFSEDRLAVVRLLGPMADLAVVRGDFSLHLEGDASWNFAMVHPLAGDAFLSYASPEGLPTVVTREHYYYAQGLTLSARLLGAFGRWESGLDLGEDDFRPVNALDRSDASPVPGTADRRARRRLWLGVRPWRTLPIKATLAGDQLVRQGRMGPMEVGMSEVRASTALGLIF